MLGGNNETYFELTYDEETGEESGNMIEFVDAFRSVSYDYYDMDADQVIGDVLSGEYEMTASQLEDKLRKSEGLMYATDDNGRLASNEIIRATFEEMGFDGVVDRRVSTKFANMSGLDENTVHYIAFEPNQVKSLYNDGGFSTSRPGMYGTKIYSIIKGSKWQGMTLREILNAPGGRKFLREKGYFD